jgi:hypothetical protein
LWVFITSVVAFLVHSIRIRANLESHLSKEWIFLISECFAFLALSIQEALIFGAQLTQPSRCIKVGTWRALLNVPWLHEIDPDNIGIENCAFRETHGCQCRKWNTCGYDLISLDHVGAVRRRYQKLDLSQVSIERGEHWAGGVN